MQNGFRFSSTRPTNGTDGPCISNFCGRLRSKASNCSARCCRIHTKYRLEHVERIMLEIEAIVGDRLITTSDLQIRHGGTFQQTA
jgi:hypothetical protein